MKKSILTLAIFSFFGLMSYAQGNLQFNQVKIVSNVQETVPAGKVWKVTSVLGAELRVNECINFSVGSTHELAHLRCARNINSGSRIHSYYIRYIILDSKKINLQVTGFGDTTFGNSNSFANSGNCTGTQDSGSNMVYWSCANIPSDHNVLPIWVPSGTTLQSGGTNTFVSVIEFNIIP